MGSLFRLYHRLITVLRIRLQQNLPQCYILEIRWEDALQSISEEANDEALDRVLESFSEQAEIRVVPFANSSASAIVWSGADEIRECVRWLGERTLIKPVEREEQTVSGIVLPDTAKERPQTAEVVAVGDAEEIKVDVGAMVAFRKYGGTEFRAEGEDYLIVEADDILGVVEG